MHFEFFSFVVFTDQGTLARPAVLKKKKNYSLNELQQLINHNTTTVKTMLITTQLR